MNLVSQSINTLPHGNHRNAHGPCSTEFTSYSDDRRACNFQNRANSQYQLPTVGIWLNAPKGLGTGGNKPLMENRRAPMISATATGYTVGNALSSGVESRHAAGSHVRCLAAADKDQSQARSRSSARPAHISFRSLKSGAGKPVKATQPRPGWPSCLRRLQAQDGAFRRKPGTRFQ